jgi:serine/threonine protein kinase
MGGGRCANYVPGGSEVVERTSGSARLTEADRPVDVIDLNLDWNRLTDIEFCANGTNCQVYFANLDLHGERVPVVVKMLRPDLECDKTVKAKLEHEIALLPNLRHRSIVRMFGAGYQPRHFLVLERLDSTLSETLALERKPGSRSRRGPFAMPWRTLLTHAVRLCEVLDWLHHGRNPDVVTMHRDLKPQNIG